MTGLSLTLLAVLVLASYWPISAFQIAAVIPPSPRLSSCLTASILPSLHGTTTTTTPITTTTPPTMSALPSRTLLPVTPGAPSPDADGSIFVVIAHDVFAWADKLRSADIQTVYGILSHHAASLLSSISGSTTALAPSNSAVSSCASLYKYSRNAVGTMGTDVVTVGQAALATCKTGGILVYYTVLDWGLMYGLDPVVGAAEWFLPLLISPTEHHHDGKADEAEEDEQRDDDDDDDDNDDHEDDRDDHPEKKKTIPTTALQAEDPNLPFALQRKLQFHAHRAKTFTRARVLLIQAKAATPSADFLPGWIHQASLAWTTLLWFAANSIIMLLGILVAGSLYVLGSWIRWVVLALGEHFRDQTRMAAGLDALMALAVLLVAGVAGPYFISSAWWMYG